MKEFGIEFTEVKLSEMFLVVSKFSLEWNGTLVTFTCMDDRDLGQQSRCLLQSLGVSQLSEQNGFFLTQIASMQECEDTP